MIVVECVYQTKFACVSKREQNKNHSICVCCMCVEYLQYELLVKKMSIYNKVVVHCIKSRKESICATKLQWINKQTNKKPQ